MNKALVSRLVARLGAAATKNRPLLSSSAPRRLLLANGV